MNPLSRATGLCWSGKY